MEYQSAHIPNQLSNNIKFLHKVVLKNHNKVLILKRNLESKTRPGAWDLPGGNSEWPKHLLEDTKNLHQKDIQREVIEETGIEVSEDLFDFKALSYFFTFFEAKKQLYSIVCAWLLEDFSEKEIPITLSTEHTEYQWISLNELDNYDFGGQKGEFIKEMIQACYK